MQKFVEVHKKAKQITSKNITEKLVLVKLLAYSLSIYSKNIYFPKILNLIEKPSLSNRKTIVFSVFQFLHFCNSCKVSGPGRFKQHTSLKILLKNIV